LQDAYRKIRNTLRYLLGNVDDFDPSASVAYADMRPIDQWAVEQLQKLIGQVREAYDTFAFHRVFSLIYNFCTVEMSSIYMDVLKDRLYCDAKDSLSRRSCQTAMQWILDALVRMLAPILVHTAEEAWQANKSKSQDVDSVHMTLMPEQEPAIDLERNEAKWEKLMQLRDEVLRVLEGLRRDQEIASNQQAAVEIVADDDEMIVAVADFGIEAFAALCIVSEVTLRKGREFRVAARKSPHAKCQRCWNYWPTVGADAEHQDLCARCIEVVSALAS
jgi:isoleucyl-tRNA synthetase